MFRIFCTYHTYQNIFFHQNVINQSINQKFVNSKSF